MNDEMSTDSPAASNLVKLEDHRRGGRGGGGVPADLRELPLSDVWNGKWFAHLWGKTTRYNHETKEWLIFRGGRWCVDITGERDRRITASIEKMRDASPSEVLIAGKTPTQLAEHYYKCLSSKSISAMEIRARAECHCTSDQFDTNPMLLNVANGTIDLATGELKPSAAEDMLMKQSPVNFDKDAQPTEWRAAMDLWFAGDKTMIAYMRRIAGLFLTGDVSDAAFFMLFGSGANGKGTFVSTLEALLGPDYAFAIPVEYFLTTRNPPIPIDVHAARGKRLVVVGENEYGAQLNVGKIKLWTSGGDTMSGKGMRENLSQYLPTHKLLLQTNHEPRFNDNTHSFARRLKKIPFLVTIADDKQKLGLKKHLRENELAGILNWAIGALKDEELKEGQLVGLADWRENRLATPEKVKLATKEMLESQDELRLFFEEACERDATFEMSRDEGYIGYRNWCDQNRVRRPLGKRSFISAMREQPDIQEAVSGHRHWRGWQGIRIGRSAPSSSGLCELCPRKAISDGRCADHPRGASSDGGDLFS